MKRWRSGGRGICRRNFGIVRQLNEEAERLEREEALGEAVMRHSCEFAAARADGWVARASRLFGSASRRVVDPARGIQ